MGDIATLRWFFENGCDVDHQVGKKKDFCRKHQRTEEFSSYSSPSRRLPTQDNNGNTVLMIAARLNHLEVAKMCLLGYNAQ